jgi:hypothetical protein
MRPIFAIRWIFVVLVVLVYPATVSYGTTITVITSDTVIQDGDTFYGVEIRDTPPAHTTVDMTGGSVGLGGMFTYDQSILNFSGGYVHKLQCDDSSTVNFTGGSVDDDLLTYGNSRVSVYDVWFPHVSMSSFYLNDSSAADIFGGWLGAITVAYDSTTLNVYAGGLNGLHGEDVSTLNIYGGEIGSGWGFSVKAQATANIYGSDFEYDPQWFWDDHFGRWISRFTGVGPDGVPIDIRGMADPFTNPNINLIPEPTTFLLCALGGLWLFRKRKTTRIVGREGGWDMRPIFVVRWVFVLVILLPCSGVRVYATTIAFYSDGIIQKGETYDKVDVYDTPPFHTTVDMTGGHVYDPGMFTYNSSTANILGGTVEALNAYGSSTVNIGGGGVGGHGESLRAHDSSTINISGGLIGLDLSSSQVVLYDSSVMNIEMSDGFIGALIYALDSSSVSIYKGSVGHLHIEDASSVNIYGGEIGDRWGFFIKPSASAKIYGSGFIYDPEWRWYEDDWKWGTGWVSLFTGIGPDGVPIEITGMPDPFTSPNISLIPEPAPALLLGLGTLALGRLKRNGY